MKRLALFAAFVVGMLIAACEKEELFICSAGDMNVENVSDTSATLTATINCSDYALVESMGFAVSRSGSEKFDWYPTESGRFITTQITGLTPSTHYNYHVIVHANGSSWTLRKDSFKTLNKNENPSLELSTQSLNFTNKEESLNFNIEANCDWRIEVSYRNDINWLEIAPVNGSGNATISVTALQNNSDVIREATICVVALHPALEDMAASMINVSQSFDSTPVVEEEEEFLYYDNFDGAEVTESPNWPDVNDFADFANAKGRAAAGVTYSGKGTTVRSKSASNSNYSDYEGSGENNIFFGDNAHFTINGLTLSAEQKQLTLSFGAEKYSSKNGNLFTPSEFHVMLSADGKKWSEIEYRFAGTDEARWNIASADFTLKSVPAKLSIKFVADVDNAYRIDDVKLMLGNGGQVVDLDAGTTEVEDDDNTDEGGNDDNTDEGGNDDNTDEGGNDDNTDEGDNDDNTDEGGNDDVSSDTKTIADILSLGKNVTINGSIEAVVVSNRELSNLTSKKGMYVQDATGALQFYLAADHEYAFGTKLKIDLTGSKLSDFNGAIQVNGLTLDKITVVSTNNSVTPKRVSITDFLANKYEGEYISIENVQVADSDLSKCWVMNSNHTSINIEDEQGNKFVVFSSKYATFGTESVAQGSGTIKGISSINNGTIQIIFAQKSDYANLTGKRFGEQEEDNNDDSGNDDNDTASGTRYRTGWYELPTEADANGDGRDDDKSTLYYAHHLCAGSEQNAQKSGKARNYSVCFSSEHHCPVWVAAPRHAMYEGSANRTDAYGKDPDIPADIQYNSKSTGGGCNKGHMLGSAERTSSSATNKQVFYYTNIAPQYSSSFNTGGGAWNNLEDHIDGLVCRDTLYEVVGCYFEQYTDKYGNTGRPAKISFGGRSDVSRPTMFYYALLRTKKGNTGKSVKDCSASELQCAAFVICHEQSKGHKPEARDIISIEELERLTGFSYFDNVPNAPKSVVVTSDWL